MLLFSLIQRPGPGDVLLKKPETGFPIQRDQKISADSPGAQHFVKNLIPKADRGIILNGGSEIYFLDIGPQAGGQAHGTGFSGGIEVASGKIMGFKMLFRIPDGGDFPVAGGIMGDQHHVVAAADDCAVPDHHRPERPAVTEMNAGSGFRYGQIHERVFSPVVAGGYFGGVRRGAGFAGEMLSVHETLSLIAGKKRDSGISEIRNGRERLRQQQF